MTCYADTSSSGTYLDRLNTVRFHEAAMNWVLVQEEHHRGSVDPYVARTIMQAAYLASHFQLGQEKDKGISSVFDKYRRHLHQCHDISQRIIQEIEGHSQALNTSLKNRQTSEVLRLPSVRNLTNDVETFLYHAKLAFRELKGLFLFTQDKKFRTTTQYNHIADWSEKRFGVNNHLSRWLRANCDWIQKLMDSRNAVEHPDASTLVIKNFHLDERGNISDPIWVLNDEAPMSLKKDMEVIPVNMLEYAEVLLVYALNNAKTISPIVIAEIPEKKRNKDTPMRFIATLKQDLDENGMYKYDRN